MVDTNRRKILINRPVPDDPKMRHFIDDVADTIEAIPDEKKQNVLNFGARGNGSYDDTAAIQKAIDAALDVGGTVVLPPSVDEYVVSSELNIPVADDGKSIQIHGHGWKKSVLRWDGAVGGTLLRIEDTGGGLVLRDLRLKGNTTNVPHALLSLAEDTAGHSNSWGIVENVMIGTIGGAGAQEFDYGVIFEGSETVNNSEWLFRNVKIDGGDSSASSVGYHQSSIQNLNHTWEGVYISRCGVGAHIVGSLAGKTVFFFDCAVDTELGASDDDATTALPRIHYMDLYAEHGGRMFDIKGSAIVSVDGGNWQITNDINADGKIILCENNSNQLIEVANFRFPEEGGYTGPNPSISVKSLSSGASVKHLVLDGIREFSNVTDGIDVATQGSTDRRLVYLRELGSTSDEAQESFNLLNGASGLNFDADRQSFRGFLEGAEISDPSAPASPTGSGLKRARTYFRDNGSGKTQFCVRFETGAVQVLATEP